MKVNYKTFSKHAEKIAKGVSEARPILRGIEHREDGTLTVTDTHRLYRAYNVNAPKNVVLDAITGEELDGNFPNTDKVIPERANAKACLHTGDVKQLKGLIKAMVNAGKVENGSGKNAKIMGFFDGVQLGLASEIGMRFTFELDGNPLDEAVYFDLQYLLDAVEMFEDMKATEIHFNLYGAKRPLTITPGDTDEVIALILPIRKG